MSRVQTSTVAPVGGSRKAEFTSRNGVTYVLRPCHTTDELDLCTALQQQCFGYLERDVAPRNMLVLAQAIGGHVIGAFTPSGALAGFAMAVAAHEPVTLPDGRWMQPVLGDPYPESEIPLPPPTPYHHSHMLAVAPEHRDSGLGAALKFAQRRDSLARGIQRMRWTFDPLAIKNASFNLNRLGATARHSIHNFYGNVDSALQGNLPTDRLVADWDLAGERAQLAEQRLPMPSLPVASQVLIPSQLAAWRSEGKLDRLIQLQSEVRDQFSTAFTDGLILHSFVPDGHGGGRYLLARASL